MRLCRPTGAHEVRSYMAALATALDALGVPPGGWFEVTLPQDGPDKPMEGGVRRSDPATAKAAAAMSPGGRASKRFKTLMHIMSCGDVGATAFELEQATGIMYRTLTPRIGELKNGGWIIGRGDTREGNMGAQQEILVATEKAQLWVRENVDGEDV